jgi:hypothetical protein
VKFSHAMDALDCIRAAVIQRHTRNVFDGAWVRRVDGILAFELRSTTGYKLGDAQRLDAWHMCEHPSSLLAKTTYEFKCSRNDFLGEIKRPTKRKFGLLVSNRFYFVVPDASVAKISEVPVECGLLVLSDGDGVRWGLQEVVKAPWRDVPAPSWAFLACVTRAERRAR